jgi:hypothetical protein
MNAAMFLSLLSFIISTFSIAAATPDLNGMVANKCSGSIVNIGRKDSDYAVVLTNGHCMRERILPPDSYVKDEKYVRSDIAVFNNKNKLIPIQPRSILYGTMEGGDIGLIEVSITYKRLKDLGIKVFELSKENSKPGEELFAASGFWKASQICTFDHNVYQILEGNYKWANAMAMSESCKIKGGWSGSPLVSKTSDQIVGVLNTVNESGERCTLNNPCEKDRRGNIIAIKDRAYGISTAVIWTCLANGKVDLNKTGCKLFRKNKLKNPDDEHLTAVQKTEWLKKLTQEYPSETVSIEVVNYDMQHMSTSASNLIFVNEKILNSYSVLELLFYTCHELGHHFGDKKVNVYNMAIEAEADYFAGSCFSRFTQKWEVKLRPYMNLYKTKNYGRCGRDVHCNKIAEIINQSFATLLGALISPDKALHDKFAGGIDTSYPEPNCRALSAISGLLEAGRPTCWFNPK